MPKQGSVEVGPPAAKGEGRARRSYLSPDKLSTGPQSAPDVKVLADILPHVAKLYGNQRGLGARDLVRMVEEEKEVTKVVGGKEVKEMKKWSYFELSDYKYQTYAEFYETVKTAASALVATKHSKDTIFNIYSSTSSRWQVMANACASQSITFATAYDSLGEEGLQHSISEPKVYGLFTNAVLLGTVASVISKTPTLKVVVYDGELKDVKAGALDTIKSAHEGVEVYSYEEFLALGKEKPVEANKPSPDDIACIMYTSGSTGPPKGVMISNGNVIAAIGAVEMLLPDVIKKGESYIAYLPLAHIMEFIVEMCLMFVGARIGYGSVKTLTDTSVRNCVGDIKAFQPTVMVGVPAVWELIRKGISAKVKAGGPVKSALFNGALAAKKFGGKGSILASVTDAVVFGAVAAGTGGKLKYVLSGGASVSKETAEFLSTALVPVLSGYGLTESTAMCCILPPEFHQFGPVGIPVPSAEVKLVDFEDAGYYSTNTPPQGEIYIRGPSITKGYFQQPELTQQEYTEDGWFKTGDIGQWNKDGTLSIIDRKKNLVKMSGGEYIAVERLESIYRSCPYVANICVYADGQANRAMAIVQPHEANVKAMVADKNLAPEAHGDLAEICKSDKVSKAILADLNATGKKAGLKPLESLQCVVLSEVEWLPTNNLVTAAQKLNRKALHAKFKPQIDAVYP